MNQPARRTGGRSAVVLASIKHALEELLTERGTEGVTIPMIAERAAVTPTSIYRRWGDLPAMMNDLATYRLDRDRPLPDTGSLLDDLREWAREMMLHYSIPANAALLRGGINGAGTEESDCLRDRKTEAQVLLDQNPASDLSVDDVLNHLVAPVMYRAIFMPWTLDEALVDSLSDQLSALRESIGRGSSN